MARIPGFHPGGPGSTPGVGKSIFDVLLPLVVTTILVQIKCSTLMCCIRYRE